VHSVNGASVALNETRPVTTVLVAVQSATVREGLVAMLGALDGFQVVGETDCSDQALELARSLRPALALVDQELDCQCWTIQAMQDEGLVSVVVAIGRRAESLAASLAGAQAYVQVGTAPRELLRALQAALAVSGNKTARVATAAD
jgi:DNA-binding NarL/FixJ family response regulator